MAVIHFPNTTPETGGFSDCNTTHMGSKAVDTKFICAEFIYPHPD